MWCWWRRRIRDGAWLTTDGKRNPIEMEAETYGINKEYADLKAVELIPEDFFWSCVDELAPFGSDEGDLALAEYRDWRSENSDTLTYDFLVWIIESMGEISIEDYNDQMLNRNLLQSQIDNKAFDDHYYIYVFNTVVIATGFSEFVDEGTIFYKNRPLIQLAINQQRIYAELLTNWDYNDKYIANLNVLERVLKAV